MRSEIHKFVTDSGDGFDAQASGLGAFADQADTAMRGRCGRAEGVGIDRGRRDNRRAPSVAVSGNHKSRLFVAARTRSTQRGDSCSAS